MTALLNIIEKIFYTDLFGSVNLYMIVSNVLKYIFVFIVLYFIYLIVKMIYLDISQTSTRVVSSGAYLHLLNQKEKLNYNVKSDYILKEDNSIGRDRKNAISIKSPYLSKHHARILQQGEEYFLEDLGSANGTQINGVMVEELTLLENRDIISLVDLDFVFMKGGAENESQSTS